MGRADPGDQSRETHFDAHSFGRTGFGADIAVPAGLLAVLFVILVPLPPGLMDALLVLNITVSLLILMTTACLASPLEFSVFPSLLLLITFFRLSLNIATTRLILGSVPGASQPAGGVIDAFANFIAGDNIVVGLIVFAIIVVVQFVVITKGATRISEVAARFALDAMPGKQMSIDNDYSSGLIDEETARELRSELSEQADFYGTMDGASKFVRGEAVAGLIITFVNIVAGFCIGAGLGNMGIAQAAEVYTRLTIGDGLVSQVPALLVSVATALLVTKNTGGENLSRDMTRQLFVNDRVLFVLGGFLLLLLASGLPKLVLIAGAGVCFGIGLYLRRPRLEEDYPSEEPFDEPELAEPHGASPESVRSLLVLEPIELEVGFRLVGFVDEGRGGDLFDRLARVRERIALELGFVMPAVKVRDNIRLRPTEYSIRLRGQSLGAWRVYPDHVFVSPIAPQAKVPHAKIGEDPITGQEGAWIKNDQGASPASAASTMRTTPELISDHLYDVVRARAAEILTREETARLVADLKDRSPVLVGELVPGVLKLTELHKVLQRLLSERISIRDLESILGVLAENVGECRDPMLLAERVRRSMGDVICRVIAGPNGRLRALYLSPADEEMLQRAAGGGEETDESSSSELERLVSDALAQSYDSVEDQSAPTVVLCPGVVRPLLQRWVQRRLPDLPVLAYEEVPDDIQVESGGVVALKHVA